MKLWRRGVFIVGLQKSDPPGLYIWGSGGLGVAVVVPTASHQALTSANAASAAAVQSAAVRKGPLFPTVSNPTDPPSHEVTLNFPEKGFLSSVWELQTVVIRFGSLMSIYMI